MGSFRVEMIEDETPNRSHELRRALSINFLCDPRGGRWNTAWFGHAACEHSAATIRAPPSGAPASARGSNELDEPAAET
jgi:hypothetical protein